MELDDQILIAVLAASDAVFLPDRSPLASPRHQVICERRKNFSTHGVPWASEKAGPGLDEAGRKQAQRALEGLVARGLVHTVQPKLAKTLGVKLTEFGDRELRAMVGLPSFEVAIRVLEQISGCENACEHDGQRWVPETALADATWGDDERRQEFVKLEDRLLPALVRGFARSNCSVHGHCWYALTKAGEKFLAKERPTSEPVKRAFSEEAKREYYYRIHEELNLLTAARPEIDREIADVPMPVCPIVLGAAS
jgi:hypothetical protein